MVPTKHHLLLADDDGDDCIFFKEALEELSLDTTLAIVNNGIELMHHLAQKTEKLPDIVFLDLNMPRKTGYECLSEIKLSQELRHIPVVIFSTSFDHEVANLLYEKGAHYYVRKPAEFSKLKELIQQVLLLTSPPGKSQPARENFVLHV